MEAIEKQRKVEAKKFKEEQRKHALIKASQLKAAQKIKDAQENILSELKVNSRMIEFLKEVSLLLLLTLQDFNLTLLTTPP
jgi:hypothetical protein